ncbi:MAG: tetratricopeptide repeat protein [Pirellulales bacterium]|nr:tetratricopeptide repeat protein [Pirellulales bacterium]
MCRSQPKANKGSSLLGYVIAIGIVGIVIVGAFAGGLMSPAENAPPREHTLKDKIRRADWLFTRANSLKNAEQAWGQTADAYQEIVEECPDNATVWFRLGYSLHSARRLDEAIEAHKVASTFKQSRPLALYNIACAYALQQDVENALSYLEQAVDAGLRCQHPIENDTDLEILLGNKRFEDLALAARPANQLPSRKQMDFWLGEWAVYCQETDQQIGTTSITKAENGFLILEKWRGANHSTGRSFNRYDPVSEKWIHHWFDGTGAEARYEGTWSDEDGKMRFQGTHVTADGQARKMRMILTPRPDRSIHQLIETFVEGGKWVLYFEANHLPKRSRSQEAGRGLGCFRPSRRGCMFRGST